MGFPNFLCSECGNVLAFVGGAESSCWRCENCSFSAGGNTHLIDLLGDETNQTSEHYSKQWGQELGFLDFIKGKPSAKSVMPAARLGWDRIFARIRELASHTPVAVFDAACGFGGLASELINEQTSRHLTYVGADIHSSLNGIRECVEGFDGCGVLVRWNISNPLPVEEKFDFVLCRASLHHTPDPERSFAALCSVLKPGGTIAVSVYNKKAICRESSDDALRGLISKMPADDAFHACQQFVVLGKALQKIQERVVLSEDMPLLGIPKGEYGVQELIYYYLLKCFNNDEYGEKYSTLVNFDWYHPQFAFRFDFEEVSKWFSSNGILVTEAITIDVQHYLEGTKQYA